MVDNWANENSEDGSFFYTTGNLTSLTRLVFASMLTLNATWELPFDPQLTSPSDFCLINDREVRTNFMHQLNVYKYYEGNGLRAVAVPIQNRRLSAIFIQPDTGSFKDVESKITIGKIDEILGLLQPEGVLLKIPSFSINNHFGSISSFIKTAGITDAFDEELPDFSNINDVDRLYLKDIYKESRFFVSEAGCVSESITSSSLESTYHIDVLPVPPDGGGTIAIEIGRFDDYIPQPPIEATFDHPFFFIIKDSESGVILFIGRVMDPTLS